MIVPYFIIVMVKKQNSIQSFSFYFWYFQSIGTKLRSESLLCSAGRIWSTRLENCAWPHEVPECSFSFICWLLFFIDFFFHLGQNICPANYSSQMRFADSVVCSQYSQCVDGRLEQRTCPNNFLFDRITKTCKPYEQAECHGDKPDVSPVQIATTTTTTAAPCKWTWIFRKKKSVLNILFFW